MCRFFYKLLLFVCKSLDMIDYIICLIFSVEDEGQNGRVENVSHLIKFKSFYSVIGSYRYKRHLLFMPVHRYLDDSNVSDNSKEAVLYGLGPAIGKNIKFTSEKGCKSEVSANK